MAVFLGCTSTGRWVYFFVVLCPGTPEGSIGSGSGFKASPKTGQRLKVSSDRLGEAGNPQNMFLWPCSLAVPVLAGWVYAFSHPTDWEKPGIEPATPGLQDIGLSPTPRRLISSIYVFLRPFMIFMVLCPGTPEGSTGSGSGFKASQKTGQRQLSSQIF